MIRSGTRVRVLDGRVGIAFAPSWRAGGWWVHFESTRHQEHFSSKQLEVIEDGAARGVDAGAGPATGSATAGAQGVDANGAPVDVAPETRVLVAEPERPDGWKDTKAFV